MQVTLWVICLQSLSMDSIIQKQRNVDLEAGSWTAYNDAGSTFKVNAFSHVKNELQYL